MSFSKLLAMRNRQQLYLCQAAELSDKFEGSLPYTIYDLASKEPSRSWAKRWARARYTCCVSCWCLSDDESHALWRIYAGEAGGVAIRSTYGRLREAIRNEPTSRIDTVKYVDYGPTFDAKDIDSINPILLKRKEFEYEREVRLWVVDVNPNGADWENQFVETCRLCKPCHLLPIDPDALIEEIVVSPFADEWYSETVVETVRMLGHQIPVSQSGLKSKPLHPIAEVPIGQLEFSWTRDRLTSEPRDYDWP